MTEIHIPPGIFIVRETFHYLDPVAWRKVVGTAPAAKDEPPIHPKSLVDEPRRDISR